MLLSSEGRSVGPDVVLGLSLSYQMPEQTRVEFSVIKKNELATGANGQVDWHVTGSRLTSIQCDGANTLVGQLKRVK